MVAPPSKTYLFTFLMLFVFWLNQNKTLSKRVVLCMCMCMCLCMHQFPYKFISKSVNKWLWSFRSISVQNSISIHKQICPKRLWRPRSISVAISIQIHMQIHTQMALELQVHFCSNFNTKSYAYQH